MTDNLKVGLPHAFTVHSSTTKRDHVTESAVSSVPGRGRRKRGGSHHDGPADRLEFSVDETEEKDERTQQGRKDDASGGAPTHSARRGGREHRQEDTAADRNGEDHNPGSILDVEA